MWRNTIKVRYDKLIINKLLDSYESSRLSRRENERTVHIEVKFIKTLLSAYFDESSGVYETIHIQMQQLEKEELIQIVWKDNKVNHIIQKVRLNVANLNNAYAFVKRTPKADLEVLKKYQSYGKKLTQNDRKRLENMIGSADESLKELIEYMLEQDVKLEQECVDI